jgi:RNA polymerase sigma factor (TIGR02999 family)
MNSRTVVGLCDAPGWLADFGIAALFPHGVLSGVTQTARSSASSGQDTPESAGELVPLVYEELRRLAAHKLANEQAGQTLQATALVHEAWLRLAAETKREWKGRTHFFASAAEAMRRILIDNARRKLALRHGGGLQRVNHEDWTQQISVPNADDEEILRVHEAVDALAAVSPRKAELVKFCYFIGLSLKEAAEVLGISERTAKRDWAYARAWLFREIGRLRK